MFKLHRNDRAEDLSSVPDDGPSTAAFDRLQGPGWFASSRELRDGLQVHEGLPADLELGAWFEGWLQVAAGGGVGLSLSAT